MKATFTLGQLFTEWDVALSSTKIGSLGAATGTIITTFVDGKKTSGNPAVITLGDHEDIDIVIGPPGTAVKVPAAFNWPAGY